MSTTAVKAMSYGLPGLSLAFTWWLPAGLQLSFLVAGILSAIQAVVFRNPAFRSMVKMEPLPEKLPDAFAPKEIVSPYRRDILTVEQMQEKYEAPQAKGVLSVLGEKVEEAKKSAREGVQSLKERAGQERKDGKRTKQELQKAEAYEKKRAKEEKERLLEMDKRRREARRLKKLEKEQGRQ
jgi:membrane protein insertase Oxa1/YidC/SpoIIIJ